MEIIKLSKLNNPVAGTVAVPGSKSYTNRALVMAALANGRSAIDGFSESDDSIAMIDSLRQLGINIEVNNGTIMVDGNGGRFREFQGTINVGAAGTTYRFLTSLCALVPGKITLDGSKRMRQRPIKPLVSALQNISADITYLENDGCPPLLIKGGKLTGGEVVMDGSKSSQYFSSLLLIAPVLSNGLTINVAGSQVSGSYIDMTLDGLRDFGITVNNINYQKYIVEPDQNYQPTNYYIEGDASAASYFWALAALSGSTAKVSNINPNSAQGDMRFADILEEMGATVAKGDDWIEVAGNKLDGITVDMESMPDTAQTLAVLTAFAKGKTRITGLTTLKIKETDRLEAVKTELAKMGIKATTGDDWIEIEGGNPRPARISTYKDHRMAMSFAVAAGKLGGMEIEEPNVVSKSFPNFWQELGKLGVKCEEA